MKIRALSLLVAPFVVLGIAACEVERRQEGELPEVDVQEGQIPEYEVETGEVEVQRDTVTVPEVEIEEPNGARR